MSAAARARAAAALAVAALAAATAGCSSPAGDAGDAPGGGRVAGVLRVVDGDTIVVALGGRSERVRYIGIDTPESAKPGAPVQCFGERAARANERLVGHGRVRLVRDVQERDRYGRLLAYVYRAGDGLLVNARLVRDGYARPLTIPPDVRFADRFRRLAAEARRAGRGLWRACGGRAQ
ncbi:MAG TPA: thermonuclease family protein [Solirubrobacteraceae bacterium]|nr:thermonuclease family protein [Solirubrobacteraceae bacterium]